MAAVKPPHLRCSTMTDAESTCYFLYRFTWPHCATSQRHRMQSVACNLECLSGISDFWDQLVDTESLPEIPGQKLLHTVLVLARCQAFTTVGSTKGPAVSHSAATLCHVQSYTSHEASTRLAAAARKSAAKAHPHTSGMHTPLHEQYSSGYTYTWSVLT